MKCSKCGMELNEGTRFCIKCGADLAEPKQVKVNSRPMPRSKKGLIIALISVVVLLGVCVALMVTGIIPVGKPAQVSNDVAQTIEVMTQAPTPAATVTPSDITIPVTHISLDRTEVTIIQGKTLPLIATVLPENADNTTLTWISDNPSVATVDEIGNITGMSMGTATITASSEDGSVTVTCTVTVQEAAALDNLNYEMTNQRNTQAGIPILLEPGHIFFNQGGKLFRSANDGSEKIQITDILDKDSEIALLNDYIYFLGTKEEVQYLYKVKSDGSQQPEIIISVNELGNKNGIEHETLVWELVAYRDKLFISLSGYSSPYYRWIISNYDTKQIVESELKKEVEYNGINHFTETWLGSGCLFYTDNFDKGMFKKPIGEEPSLLSSVSPKNILSDDKYVYYIDIDYNTLNRMTLEGTLPEKLQDNVSYYTMTDSGDIFFVSGDKVYKTDKGFATPPVQVAEGITKFVYSGDFLYYIKPDSGVWRVVLETGTHEMIAEGITE